jgi:hypothetical protein
MSTTKDYRDALARLGARDRVIELQREVASLFAFAPEVFATRTCPQLVRLRLKQGHANGTTNGTAPPRTRHKWTKAQRAAAGARMKARWAAGKFDKVKRR